MKLTDDELNELSSRVADKLALSQKEWINKETAKKMLGLGRTSLAELRKQEAIVYSKVSTKHIMYSRSSILEYLESKTNK